MTGLTRANIHLFGSLPAHREIDAARIQADVKHDAVLRHLRSLTDLGLVEEVCHRPVTVRIPRKALAATLHAAVNSPLRLEPLLAGSPLKVVAALASLQDASIADLRRQTGLSENTVRSALGELRDRGLLSKPVAGRMALAGHAILLRSLGHAYAEHCIQDRLPRGSYVVVQAHGPHVIVSASEPLEGVAPTAATRFAEAGADVIPGQFQYRVHAFLDRTPSLREAFQDAVALGTAPRTLDAMEAFMEAHG